jgi:hypothetical protein
VNLNKKLKQMSMRQAAQKHEKGPSATALLKQEPAQVESTAPPEELESFRPVRPHLFHLPEVSGLLSRRIPEASAREKLSPRLALAVNCATQH